MKTVRKKILQQIKKNIPESVYIYSDRYKGNWLIGDYIRVKIVTSADLRICAQYVKTVNDLLRKYPSAYKKS